MCLLRSNSVLVPLLFSLPLLLKAKCFWLDASWVALSVLPLLLYLLHFAREYCPSISSSPLRVLFACGGKTVYSHVEQKYWSVGLFGYYRYNHVVLISPV